MIAVSVWLETAVVPGLPGTVSPRYELTVVTAGVGSTTSTTYRTIESSPLILLQQL